MKWNLSDEYDHAALRRYCVSLLVLIVLMKLTAGYAAIGFALLALSSLIEARSVALLWWTLFLTLSSIGNPVIFGRSFVSVMTVRVILVALTFLLAGRVFSSRSSRCMMPMWGIMLYILWECFVSAQGYAPVVSYLKLFLFCCIFLAMFGVANEVNASTRVNAKILRASILSIVAFMSLGSVALMPFPALSTMTGKAALELMQSGDSVSLFCGMCAHSQAMGPMAGVLGTFLLADLVFSIRQWDLFYLLMLASCPFICWYSGSRTGMGTMIAGFGMVVLLFMQSRGVGAKWKGKVLSVAVMIAVAGGVAIAAVPAVRERVAQFAVKTAKNAERKEVTIENMFSSRQGKIDIAMYNFRKKPLLGNGFQVSWEMEGVERSGIFAYLAAPIEKGVWIYAVLEEGGVVGMVLFAGWLVILMPLLYQRHAYIMACTFFAFVMANVGEFCIFAMTYLGGFYWTLTFAAATLDVQRMKGQNIQIYDVPIEQVMEEVGMDEWVRIRG